MKTNSKSILVLLSVLSLAIGTVGCAKKKDQNNKQIPYSEKNNVDLNINQIPYATTAELDQLLNQDLTLENMQELDSQNYLWTLASLRHPNCNVAGGSPLDPHSRVGHMRLFKEAQAWATGYQYVEENKEILSVQNLNSLTKMSIKVKRPLQTEYQITKTTSSDTCSNNGSVLSCTESITGFEVNKLDTTRLTENAKKGLLTGRFCTSLWKYDSRQTQYFRADINYKNMKLPVLVVINKGDEYKIKCSDQTQKILIETLEIRSFRHIGLTREDCFSGTPIIVKKTFIDSTNGQELGHSVTRLAEGALRQ